MKVSPVGVRLSNASRFVYFEASNCFKVEFNFIFTKAIKIYLRSRMLLPVEFAERSFTLRFILNYLIILK